MYMYGVCGLGFGLAIRGSEHHLLRSRWVLPTEILLESELWEDRKYENAAEPEREKSCCPLGKDRVGILGECGVSHHPTYFGRQLPSALALVSRGCFGPPAYGLSAKKN